MELRSFGGLQRGECSEHGVRGVQFVPSHWRDACRFCYDESEFYREVILSTLYGLQTTFEEASAEEIIKHARTFFGDDPTPADFVDQLADWISRYRSDSEDG